MVIYGTMICPDCADCKKTLEELNIPFEYKDFGESTANIKEFLKYRDNSPLFDEIREAGKIGIPCVVLDDGSLTLDWESVLPDEIRRRRASAE